MVNNINVNLITILIMLLSAIILLVDEIFTPEKEENEDAPIDWHREYWKEEWWG